MKAGKLFKRLGVGLATVLVVAAAATAVNFYALSPRMRPAPDLTAPTDSVSVANGQYLVEHVAACIGCHSPVQEEVPGDPPVPGMIGAGRDFGDAPGSPGHIIAPNITPDPETGIAEWTDGELARAIREGVDKDGRALFPQMPYHTYRETLSDKAVLEIIAYIRTLEPVKNDPGRTSLRFPVSMFVRGMPAPLDVSPAAEPSPSDVVARGDWLLKTASCYDCHDAVNDRMEKIPGMALSGGMKFPLPGDKGYAIAPNITSDNATGIGSYTEEDLHRVFEEGVGKNGRNLYVMPWYYYKGMTDADRDALVKAVKRIPAVSHAVAPSAVRE